MFVWSFRAYREQAFNFIIGMFQKFPYRIIEAYVYSATTPTKATQAKSDE